MYRKFRKSVLEDGNNGIKSRFIDKGFVSTSVEKEGLKKVIHSDTDSYDSIAKIIVPSCTKGVYIGDIFDREEKELLLNRGLVFEFLSVNDNIYNFKILQNY